MAKFMTGYRSPIRPDGTFVVLTKLPTGDYEKAFLKREKTGNRLLRAEIVYWQPPQRAKVECVPYVFGETSA
jgi:hypothetical protein